MYLYDLAPDAMARICEFGGPMAVIRFWLSGAPSLRRLLSNYGGVRTIQLLDSSTASASRWPAVLGELHGLTELRLSSPHSSLNITQGSLEQLSHLRVFHLTCIGSERLALELNLGKLFPKLQDLHLSFLSARTPPFHLPKTLTRLSLGPFAGYLTFGNGVEDFKLPNLQYFVLSGALSQLSLLEGYPLTELHSISVCALEEASKLPKSIIKLTMETYWEHSSSPFLRLPFCLQHLDLFVMQPRMRLKPIRSLLRLRTLRLRGPTTSFREFVTIADADQPIFPISLEELEIQAYMDADVLILPPYLKRLSLASQKCFNFRTEIVDSLAPSSPSQYSVSADTSLDSVVSPQSPSNIGIQNSEDGIPATLLSLDIQQHLNPSISTDIIEGLWRTPLHTIPMTRLSLDHVTVAEDCFTAFPITLTYLEVYECFPQSQDQLQRLAHLQSLKIVALTRKIDSNILFGISPSVSSLVLEYLEGFDEAHLVALPARLSLLHLMSGGRRRHPKCDPLSIVGFRLLRRFRGLLSLKLRFDMVDFQDWMLSCIPRSVETLQLPFIISSAGFAYLPFPLLDLNLKYMVKVDLADMQYLPRAIRRILVLTVYSDTSANSDPAQPRIATIRLPLATYGMPSSLASAEMGNTRWLTTLTYLQQQEHISSVNERSVQGMGRWFPQPLLTAYEPLSVHERRTLCLADSLAPLVLLPPKKRRYVLT